MAQRDQTTVSVLGSKNIPIAEILIKLLFNKIRRDIIKENPTIYCQEQWELGLACFLNKNPRYAKLFAATTRTKTQIAEKLALCQ